MRHVSWDVKHWERKVANKRGVGSAGIEEPEVRRSKVLQGVRWTRVGLEASSWSDRERTLWSEEREGNVEAVTFLKEGACEGKEKEKKEVQHW